jgi:CRP-like cAMP-binding protein
MFIQEAELFKGLTQDFMNELSKILVEESYGGGTVLFEEGDPAGFLYVLAEGRVRLAIGQQAEIEYSITNPGDAFGWSSLVARATYTARAECVAPSRLIRIEKEQLNKVLTRHPGDAMEFFKRLAAAIGHRLIVVYNAFLESQGAERPESFGSGQVLQASEE